MFTVATFAPTVIFTVVSPFLAVIVFVSASKSILAPTASNIALTGTIVLPSIIVGGTSADISLPLICKEILLSSPYATVTPLNNIPVDINTHNAFFKFFFIKTHPLYNYYIFIIIIITTCVNIFI